jgi:hypothetical protein
MLRWPRLHPDTAVRAAGDAGDVGIPDLKLIGVADAAGKSSAYFYFSADQRYVVKLATTAERDLMLEILDGYYLRMEDAKRDAGGRGKPHTLLPQIFGMYTVKVAGGLKKHWIVMSNFMATKLKLDYKFDLKGSRHKRDASENELKKGVGATLKDNDFVKVRVGTPHVVLRSLGFPHIPLQIELCLFLSNIWVRPGQAKERQSDMRHVGLATAELQAVMYKDVQLLSQHRLIDYSLLLGIHLLPPLKTAGGILTNSNWRGPQWRPRFQYSEGDCVYPHQLQGLCYCCAKRGITLEDEPDWLSFENAEHSCFCDGSVTVRAARASPQPQPFP